MYQRRHDQDLVQILSSSHAFSRPMHPSFLPLPVRGSDGTVQPDVRIGLRGCLRRGFRSHDRVRVRVEQEETERHRSGQRDRLLRDPGGQGHLLVLPGTAVGQGIHPGRQVPATGKIHICRLEYSMLTFLDTFPYCPHLVLIYIIESTQLPFLRLRLRVIPIEMGRHMCTVNIHVVPNVPHQNKGCVLLHGPHTKTELLFCGQRVI